MYSSSFYPFDTQEEKWAYFSRHIKLNGFDAEVGNPYIELLKLVKEKDYFVLTTNVDALFHKAGFGKTKVFMVQGDYGKNQCGKGCHKILYDNEKLIQEMVLTQKNCMIPTSLVPKCPVCGGNMTANLRADEFFVEDKEWEQSNFNYHQFLSQIKGTNVVMIEIGVGFNTPGIIKYPFEQITFVEPCATLIRINKDDPDCHPENAGKTISFSEDTETILKDFNKP